MRDSGGTPDTPAPTKEDQGEPLRPTPTTQIRPSPTGHASGTALATVRQAALPGPSGRRVGAALRGGGPRSGRPSVASARAPHVSLPDLPRLAPDQPGGPFMNGTNLTSAGTQHPVVTIFGIAVAGILIWKAMTIVEHTDGQLLIESGSHRFALVPGTPVDPLDLQ